MKNNKSILSYIVICCMMIFCSNGMFGQGVLGEYPGAGVGFDAGCGYPSAGNSDPGVSDTAVPGNVCGSPFDISSGAWVETASGFDIGGFDLNNYDINMEAVYGVRLFYGPQDNCCTICLDAVIDLQQPINQGSPCGTFSPQFDLSTFGYPVPANFSNDIFGSDIIPYTGMCPNTEYFAQYQFFSATDVDLSDPDGNDCAMNDALIANFGMMSTVQTLVAPGTRDPIVINAATLALAGVADCNTDVVLDYDIDITSGCAVQFPNDPLARCSKGIEFEFRANLTCADQSTLVLGTGGLVNDPTACLIGTGTLGGQAPNTGQITLGTVAEVCAILECDPNASLELYATHTFCEADDINGDGTGSDEAVQSISLATILTAYGDAGAMCCAVPGCTDPCAPNFDPLATEDDGSCMPYDMTCNADCTAGPFGGTWDPTTCACINETTPINGCTDATANNFDPNANCDDGSCTFPVPGCTDPCAPNFDPLADTDDGTCEPYDMTCNADCTAGPFDGTWDATTCACINEITPVNGCTDATANNFDPNANCDDGSCTNAVPGCTDPCADNFDPAATTDDGSCNPYDDTCNADCTAGPFGGTWDATTCACINETTPVNGCTDATANNFDPNANCDDGSCTFPVPGCTDPCAPNFDPLADTDNGSCDAYDDTCNADCTAGPFGGTWDATTCACINETTPVSGCTDPTANNFDPNANCDDGSCSNAVPGCTDPCADNFDPAATTDDGSCNPYDDTCNADCTAGPFGGTWDATTCACINETTPVNGCTDPGADNYNPAANCDDGSCVTTQPLIVIEDPCNCELGIDLNGDPEDGNELAAEIVTISGGSGNYSIQAVSGLTQSDGVTLITIGTADLTGNQVVAYIPVGNTYSITIEDTTTGETVTLVGGPCPSCAEVANIPTVGEWGLIILGLLMSITAIVGIRARREEEATA